MWNIPAEVARHDIKSHTHLLVIMNFKGKGEKNNIWIIRHLTSQTYEHLGMTFTTGVVCSDDQMSEFLT